MTAEHAEMHLQRRYILIRGIVQGVGFRPFVYNLARSLGLTGFVFNSSSGVSIEIEGSPSGIDQFLDELKLRPPQMAEIVQISTSVMAICGDKDFAILPSREEPGAFALVPTDIGTCDACWRDFGNPANRRFGYPFTNCTHCGPRYTIIHNLPYDRATTTMAAFAMCRDCRQEYEDPSDRRFHAQPNACPVCGPSLALVETHALSTSISFGEKDSLPLIQQARTLLREGKILAVKGLGGFLLACDATNDAAVAELRMRKRRPHKPFALMVRDLATARSLCAVSPADEAALLHPRRPIVILPKLPETTLSPAIAPGDQTLGIMLPYTPLHYLLFSDSPQMPSQWTALVMTSGNLSEEPIVIANQEAMSRLGDVADWFLLHNREIATRVDDSLVRTVAGQERVLRRSRGFVPQTIDLGVEVEEVLAFGSELKNTFCLTKGRYAILSQHIGDLQNLETMQFFEETLAGLKRLFKVTPRAVAYDLHPGYMSTRMALAAGIEPRFGVQHHHAHIASCMAENHLHGKVIGVAMDGTGFGSDGKIWGGEFLLADFAGFSRRAHLRNVLLPGGDAAVRQPWRMALSYLRDTFGETLPSGVDCFAAIDQRQVALVDAMIERRIQSVETSSCGRLFDAVSALLGFASDVTFEGQAAIALEAAADDATDDHYGFEIQSGDPLVLDLRSTIAAIVRDLVRKRSVGTISARFHNTLSVAIGEVCGRMKAIDAIDRVCLSGGSFQNVRLLNRTIVELEHRGFTVFLHSRVPANDGGIALGQALIANQRLRG